MRFTFFACAILVMLAMPAAAQQQVTVSFHDNGRVSVDATAASVRTILNEWAKNGGTKVVGADRIAGAPLTLKLVDVSEAQALETILRSVAGYMAAPRQAASGPSMYDRIMIMATSSAPLPPSRPTPATNPNAFNGTQRFIPPRFRNQNADQDEEEEPDENPPNPPVFTFPQPGRDNSDADDASERGYTNFQGADSPGIVINPAAPAGQPAMPTGVSRPGMILPPPQQQPAQPTTRPSMIRPPGRDQ